MTRYLLDTNIISDVIKNIISDVIKPEPEIVACLDGYTKG